MDFSASNLYGGAASAQPSPTPAPGHAPGPEPMAKTLSTPTGAGFQNPAFLLVALVAVAFGLIRFSVRVGG